MSEIMYFWQGGLKAVAVSSDVQLPQFHVLGYRQSYRVISLTTGMNILFICVRVTCTFPFNPFIQKARLFESGVQFKETKNPDSYYS